MITPADLRRRAAKIDDRNTAAYLEDAALQLESFRRRPGRPVDVPALRRQLSALKADRSHLQACNERLREERREQRDELARCIRRLMAAGSASPAVLQDLKAIHRDMRVPMEDEK